MQKSVPSWKISTLQCLFMSLAFLLFANTFGNEWTLDDFPVLVNNPDIKSIENFLRNQNPVRPVRELSLMLDYYFYGMNPSGYHIQNIFWHGLNACLILVLVIRLCGDKSIALLASLLFLVHPIQVEAVANISNRKDSISLALSLLSLLAYTKAFDYKKKKFIWLTVAFTILAIACLAKENAIALIIAFAAYELAYIPTDQRFLFKHKYLCFSAFAISIFIFFGWYYFFGGRQIHHTLMSGVMAKMGLSFSGSSTTPYYLMVLKSLTFMYGKILIPFNLAPEYTYSVPKGWGDGWVITAVVVIGLYLRLLWTSYLRSPFIFFALVWILAFWLPASNLFPFSYFAADRYLYAPMVGISIFISFIIIKVFQYRGRIYLNLVLILILSLSALTWKQNSVWESKFNLWGKSVAVNPESTTSLNNLGVIYMERGEIDKAISLFHRAAANFNNPLPYYHLGEAYEKKGNYSKAFGYYKNFLKFNDPAYKKQADDLIVRINRQYQVKLK